MANGMNSVPATPQPTVGYWVSPPAGAESPLLSGNHSMVLPGGALQSHSFHTFGEYSQFLRSAVADEESLQIGESLQALAVQIETLVAILQRREGEYPPLAMALINLVGDLRAHRVLLLALGDDWHRFYEFDAHFAALNQFRISVTHWAMEAAPPNFSVPPLTEFDLAAWRVLGAGSLLLDVYEQSRKAEIAANEEPASATLWGRWNAWWTRRKIRQQVVRQEGRRGRRKGD
jgi:hypothetical protein